MYRRALPSHMTPTLGSLDPAYLAVLLIGLVGATLWILETIVFKYHPDALAFVVAFATILLGAGAAAVDPELASTTAQILYHGVAVMVSGVAFFLMAFARRRIMLRTGEEGEDVNVLGSVDGGVE